MQERKNQAISVSSEYIKDILKNFNMKRPGLTKVLRNIGALEREKLRRNFNQTVTKICFYSKTHRYVSTVVIVMRDFKVSYIGTSFKENVLVSKYYHSNSDKNFLKYFHFEKPVQVLKSLYFPQILFVYQKKNKLSICNQDVQEKYIYLSEFYYQDLVYHKSGFVITLPKTNHLQNLLTLKINLLNETTLTK